jgi:Domain of unknown function (DUF4845)
MLDRNRQNGMTFWGLLVIATLFIFFVVLFFKLLPPYMEYAKVKNALEGIAKQPGTSDLEKSQIKAAFDRRFNIDSVDDIDLNKALIVEKKPGSMTIRITYERRVPLAYNVTALIEFDDTAQVPVR